MAARTLYTAGITGVGMSFPEKRLTNADLEKLVDTDDQWIVERTGIKERRIAEKGTGASVHGSKAAEQAMEHAQAGKYGEARRERRRVSYPDGPHDYVWRY